MQFFSSCCTYVSTYLCLSPFIFAKHKKSETDFLVITLKTYFIFWTPCTLLLNI